MSKRLESSARLASLVSCLTLLSAPAAAQEPVSLPPFVVTGRVIDYDGAGLKSAEVRVRKGGTLLARGKVGSFNADTPCNYAVSVPMSSTDMPTAACTGDSLTLEVDAGSAVYSSTNVSISAAKPGRPACNQTASNGRWSNGKFSAAKVV